MADAGLGRYQTNAQARTLSTFTAFWVADEPVKLAVFRQPAVARHEVGSARLPVITESRAIEVSGQMAGDWSCNDRPIQNGPVSTSIRDLNDFSGVTFESEAVQWVLEDDDARNFTRRTTVTLIGQGRPDPLTVWSTAQNEFARGAEEAELAFLQWMAARRGVAALDADAASTAEERL